MILVTGCTGFLGKRVCRFLMQNSTPFIGIARHNGPDLRDRQATLDFFCDLKPLQVINCAAFVGGIQFGYGRPAEIFHQNLQMTLNLLEGAHKSKVQRIVNPISNCAYPGEATFFREDEFWDGPLHESVLAYGFVRKASWVGGWAYSKQYDLDVINLTLSNMYGPEDHFEEERSHALGALIMKMVKAKHTGQKEVIVWGSGKPIREWLHVDDGAEAMVKALNVAPCADLINIGIGKGISILEMAILIKDLVGFEGELVFDLSKPDGAPHKTVDGSRGAKHFGWIPQRDFRQGVAEAIDWYINNGDKDD
jgi:GDP-L-fucose synthase